MFPVATLDRCNCALQRRLGISTGPASSLRPSSKQDEERPPHPKLELQASAVLSHELSVRPQPRHQIVLRLSQTELPLSLVLTAWPQPRHQMAFAGSLCAGGSRWRATHRAARRLVARPHQRLI